MPAPKQTGIDADIVGKMTDELGFLERELAPWRAKLARVEILRKAIRATFDASPADSAFEVGGANFVAVVGARALERSINPLKLIKAIGLKAYAAFATCTLRALEENVAPEIVAGVVTSANTGHRTIKTFERVS